MTIKKAFNQAATTRYRAARPFSRRNHYPVVLSVWAQIFSSGTQGFSYWWCVTILGFSFDYSSFASGVTGNFHFVSELLEARFVLSQRKKTSIAIETPPEVIYSMREERNQQAQYSI